MTVMGSAFFNRPFFHLMSDHISNLQRQFFSLFHRLFQFFVHFFRQAGLHDRIVKYIFSENLNHVYILTHFSYPFRLTPISISMFSAAMFSAMAHRLLASKKAVHFFDKQTAYLLPCISKLV